MEPQIIIESTFPYYLRVMVDMVDALTGHMMENGLPMITRRMTVTGMYIEFIRMALEKNVSPAII